MPDNGHVLCSARLPVTMTMLHSAATCPVWQAVDCVGLYQYMVQHVVDVMCMYVQVEYLICYASAGLTLQFCAVGRQSPTPQLVDLSRQWILSHVHDRVRVMMCTLMLFPVLMHQLDQLPSTHRKLAETVERSNGTVITYWDDKVEKTVDLRLQPTVKPDIMMCVYQAAQNCPQLVQLYPDTSVAVSGEYYRVFLVPFGVELSSLQPPKGLALREAIR